MYLHKLYSLDRRNIVYLNVKVKKQESEKGVLCVTQHNNIKDTKSVPSTLLYIKKITKYSIITR